MTLKERFMRRLTGKEVDVTPVGCTTAYPVVEFMSRCGYARPLADVDPLALTELSLAGYKYAGFEWVKAMGWDLTALSETFGCGLGEPAIDLQYYIKVHPFEHSLDGLYCPEDLLTRGRFPAYKEQFRLLKERVGDELAIFGMSEGPFTCASNLLEASTIMRAIIKDPEKVGKVLDVAVEAVTKAAQFAFSNGADYFCLGDPTSSPDLLSPKAYEKYVLPAVKKVVADVGGPIVLHVCGNTDSIIHMMCDTGVAAISVEEKTDLKKAVEIAHAKGVKVFGNVGTSSTLFMGSPEECYKEAVTALENGVDFLAPGCGIAPQSPIENILQLKKARDDYFRNSREIAQTA
jgi:[methyl-Co(III) methanol-specific corrinoid protein]:coenzyme M methyltransferase